MFIMTITHVIISITIIMILDNYYNGGREDQHLSNTTTSIHTNSYHYNIDTYTYNDNGAY